MTNYESIKNMSIEDMGKNERQSIYVYERI